MSGSAPAKAKQGFLRNIRVGPRLFQWGINLWPAFLGAGIRVQRIAPDFSEMGYRRTNPWQARRRQC